MTAHSNLNQEVGEESSLPSYTVKKNANEKMQNRISLSKDNNV